MTFISIHSVIIYVVFFGACMRCTRLCSLKPGVTARYVIWATNLENQQNEFSNFVVSCEIVQTGFAQTGCRHRHVACHNGVTWVPELDMLCHPSPRT
jgi:hypothetical protein